MPFDPNLPAENSPLSSAEMRGQLTGLQSNITAATADKVTQGQVDATVDAAVAGTAQNPAGVAPLGITADASYQQPQMQEVIDKVNELISALYRP